MCVSVGLYVKTMQDLILNIICWGSSSRLLHFYGNVSSNVCVCVCMNVSGSDLIGQHKQRFVSHAETPDEYNECTSNMPTILNSMKRPIVLFHKIL